MPAHDSVISLLQAMVRLNTVNRVASGNPRAEAPMVELVEAFARDLGLTPRRLAVPDRVDNVLLTVEVDPDAPWIMFESHMDTVTIENMTIDPFAAEIRDGRLWGRGACDTKGTGATMFWALSQYLTARDQPNNVALIFTVDEEYGMTGAKALVETHREHLGFDPVGIIVGEPTLLQPIVAHNGCVRWIIRTHGVAAHASDPSQGRSAISDMVHVIRRLEEDYIPSLSATHPLTGKAQASINIIRGGVQINVIPEVCEIHIDRRLTPGEDPGAVLPAITELLADLAGQTPGLTTSMEHLFTVPPLPPEPAMKLLPTVQTALRALGLDSAPGGVPYGTDGGVFGHAGIPTIVLGPGSIAQAHTKDEWIALDQVERGVEVYFQLMQADWSGA